MTRQLTIAMLIVIGVGAVSPQGQSRLGAVPALRCSFTRQATGGWTKEGVAEAKVDTATLLLRFEAIDTDSGTAKLRSGTVTADSVLAMAAEAHAAR